MSGIKVCSHAVRVKDSDRVVCMCGEVLGMMCRDPYDMSCPGYSTGVNYELE